MANCPNLKIYMLGSLKGWEMATKAVIEKKQTHSNKKKYETQEANSSWKHVLMWAE